MPFLPPNQQRQSTEGKKNENCFQNCTGAKTDTHLLTLTLGAKLNLLWGSKLNTVHCENNLKKLLIINGGEQTSECLTVALLLFCSDEYNTILPMSDAPKPWSNP